MLIAKHLFLVAMMLVSAAATINPDVWSVCDALTKAESIGIPGGSGTCSTVCQVDNDCANFELECDLNDCTKTAAESVKTCSALKLLIELFVANKYNCQATCGNSREPHTFDLKVVCQ